jgi:hypothetical protein
MNENINREKNLCGPIFLLELRVEQKKIHKKYEYSKKYLRDYNRDQP